MTFFVILITGASLTMAPLTMKECIETSHRYGVCYAECTDSKGNSLYEFQSTNPRCINYIGEKG